MPPRVRPSSITASTRLLTLRLRDFRGFAKLDLALPAEGPLVLIGVNGAGKSTVLEAIAMFLSPFVTLASGLALRQADMQIAADDVQVGKPLATVEAAFTIGGVEHYWSLHANRAKGSVGDAAELGQHARAFAERLRVGRTVNLPVLCAYSAGRGLGEGGGGKRPTYLEAYDRAFAPRLGPYQDFLRWFRDEEDAENYARVHDDPAYRNPRLEVVRRALSTFLREIGADVSDLQMKRFSSSGPGRPAKPALLTLKKGDVRLRIEQLSDGERNTLLLVADLARRLAVANPARTDPLQGDGIVLIDDLERDLHPGWQRAFLPTLSAVFPGCQLIVTTHSPQVLSRMHRENVFIFENFDLVRVTPHTYGRDSNSILGEVMGLPERPADVQEKIRQASILIDEERLDEAKVALDELVSILGDDDNVVVRLRTLASFLEDRS